ncbi:MAG: phosphotransferase [Chloroflexi bacterium]|nr:phosphotransferase [Chloroflexota bacterium]
MLKRGLGHRVKVASIRKDPSPFTTTFPAEVLHVELESGEKTSIFLKRLGCEESDHPEKQRRDREIRLYEGLLKDDDLPVAKYYGSTWNAATHQYELFLEHVDDWNLKYQGLDVWFTAARRIAHLHAYFSARVDRLLASDFLLHFDDSYFWFWAHRAVSVVAERSPDLAANLDAVVRNYDLVTDLITSQPLTLVHNDLSPKNVIADRSRTPARIIFVDWEMAGVGCGALDLVHLKYGLDRASDRRMREAYCGELTGTGLVPTGAKDRNSLFMACEVHKTVYRLAFSTTWQLPIETVSRWVAETQQFLRGIQTA